VDVYKLVYTEQVLDKPLVWLGSSLEDLRAFPPEARRLAGYQLRRVQSGLMPSDWKPLKSIGPGVYEIRIRTGLEHRVFYVARRRSTSSMPHAFEKRTRRTRQADIDLAKQRLAEITSLRGRAKEN